MKFKKTTRLTTAISMILLFTFCFGATAAGAYATPTPSKETTETVVTDTIPTSSEETIKQEITDTISIPINLDRLNSGEYIWLGEYTLSVGDRIHYDVSAETGNGMRTGFASLKEDPANTSYYTVSNKRRNGILENKADFTFEDFIKPGQYRLYIQATDGDLTNIKGDVIIQNQPSLSISESNPSLTLDISSAAVEMIPAIDGKISAEYNRNVYQVEINDQNNDWDVKISCKTRTNTNTETIKLFIPDVSYRDIKMKIDSAHFTSSMIRAGNITGNFNTASVILTLPKGFIGSIDATAESGYFELISKDNFQNSNVTVIDEGEFGAVNAPQSFIKDGNTLTYANGTQRNVMNITQKGSGVIKIYSPDLSNGLYHNWESEWMESWEKSLDKYQEELKEYLDKYQEELKNFYRFQT